MIVTYQNIFLQSFQGAGYPHIRILLTNGLMGLLTYLLLIVFSAFTLLRCHLYFRANGDTFMVQFSLTALLICILYVLTSTTLAISLISSITWYFWIFIGITVYQRGVSRSKEEKSFG